MPVAGNGDSILGDLLDVCGSFNGKEEEEQWWKAVCISGEREIYFESGWSVRHSDFSSSKWLSVYWDCVVCKTLVSLGTASGRP